MSQFQNARSQPVIISIQESLVVDGSTFTEDEEAGGATGSRSGGGETACATCVGALSSSLVSDEGCSSSTGVRVGGEDGSSVVVDAEFVMDGFSE